jgi:hypothetical protein
MHSTNDTLRLLDFLLVPQSRTLAFRMVECMLDYLLRISESDHPTQQEGLRNESGAWKALYLRELPMFLHSTVRCEPRRRPGRPAGDDVAGRRPWGSTGLNAANLAASKPLVFIFQKHLSTPLDFIHNYTEHV